MVDKKYQIFENYYSSHYKNSHNSTAKDYEIQCKYFKKNYGHLLPKDKNSPILEIGCGTGHFLLFLKQNGYTNFWGVDVSSECVDICLKNGFGTAKNILNVDAVTFLKQSGIFFECIVMNDVIEHLPKDEIIGILSVINSQLTKTGLFIAKMPNMANPITAASGRYIDITHTIGFTEESISQVLHLSKFQDIHIVPQDIWVFNPIVNIIGKTIHRVMSGIFLLFFFCYGRASTRIFSKDLIAYAKGS